MQFLQPPPEPSLSDAYVPFPHFLHVLSSVGSYVAAFPLFHLPGGQSLHPPAAGATAYWPFVQSVQSYEVASSSG